LEPGAEADVSGRVAEYNSAVLVGDSGVALQSYRKRHLVPFGEFLPFREWAPGWLRELVPGDLTPGREANLLHLTNPRVRIGALVCFEDSLAAETRALVREGAQLLVNLTNDAWFGTVSGPFQHAAQARLRAIEQGLPLVRVANTGLTEVIDPRGRITAQLPFGTSGFLDASLPAGLEAPPYAKWGEIPALVLLAGCFVLALRRPKSAKA
jgi:apolipoprotein N-acyltransferase